MKKFISVSACLLFMLPLSIYSQYNHANLKLKRSAEFSDDLAESPEQYDVSYTYENLRLFPIIANDAFVEEHKDLGKFTLLKDAIETDKIIITETGAANLANSDASDAPVLAVPDNSTSINSNASAVRTTSDSPETPVEPEVLGNVSEDVINDNRAYENGLPAEPNPVTNVPSDAVANPNLDEGIIYNDIQQVQVQSISDMSFGDASVSGTVNTLFAQNQSVDSIFIMAGEVVKGGKQDRVIAQDIVLAPGEKIDLSAFCVEKSRWTTKDNNQGEFTDYYNVSSMDIREAVTEDQSQNVVWSTVDEHTSKNGAESSTKAYTNLENSKEYQKNVAAYLEKLQNAFSADGRIIGVIAVSGSEVIGLDMFATHELFNDSYQNLIHSYVGHAITKGDKVTITNEEVFAYLDTILKDEKKQNEVIEKNGTVYEYKNKKLHIAYY